MTARDVKLQFHGGAMTRHDEPAGVVGKRTLVQMAAIAAPRHHEQVHQVAQAAIIGPAGPMPHGARLQQLFGRHDISGIQAHSDATAAAGTGAMGAQAFALGNHVAFAGAPSLHTAAHEAAHVVQQRAGVHLKNGVGEAGDACERHADAVADRVVAGQSAEALLDTMAPAGGTGTGSPAVQCEMTMARLVGDGVILNVTFLDSYFRALPPLDDPEAAASQEVALTDPFIDAIEGLGITPTTAAAYTTVTQLQYNGYAFTVVWRPLEQRLYVSQIGQVKPLKPKRKQLDRETTTSRSKKQEIEKREKPSSRKHTDKSENSDESDDEHEPTREELLAPYRYGGQVYRTKPQGSMWIACHYTSPEAVPAIQTSGVVISKALNGTGAAVSKVNQDGEGFYTTTDDKWPYYSPDKSQVRFGVYVHPKVVKLLVSTQMPPQHSFTTQWWQEDEQLAKYITQYDIIKREAGTEGHDDLKFNPRAVPYLALVLDGHKQADPTVLKLREQHGFGSSTPKSTASDTLSKEQEVEVIKLLTSTVYQSADEEKKLKMRQELASRLGVLQRLFTPFRREYEK